MRISWPRFLLGLAVVALIAGAAAWWIRAPSGPGWHDANLHAVDGIWITGEDPCGPTSSDDLCQAAGVAAGASLTQRFPDAPQSDVVALARLPNTWFNAHGEQILLTTGGLSHPRILIVDLADGRRLAIGLLCDPIIETGGQPPRPANCFEVPDVLATYRVDGGGPNAYRDSP